MDKDLLRIVIIALGATVILGMVLWSIFKAKGSRREIDFYDKGNPLDHIDDSLILDTSNDDFEIVPLGSALDDEFEADPISVASTINNQQDIDDEVKVEIEQTSESIFELPKIIQFSLVATLSDGFNGNELVEALELVGLEYGSMKVFERVDEQRRVDFAVASMVEPGTFPETDLDSFNSPGLVFFLQPHELDNPLAVFNDLIQTINSLASKLGGQVLDHQRQPLSDEVIDEFRHAFS